MRTLSLLFCCFFSIICVSQTKLISHKSHSGSDKTFRISLEKNLFDIENSNLGDIPYRTERNSNLDSVIYISKDKAIMVTSEHCVNADRRTHKIYETSKWQAGRQTVYNHQLFSKVHSLDSIKLILKEQYYFQNDIDKTVFVGFDNGEKPVKKSKEKKKSIIPIFNSDSNFPSKPFLILSLILLSSIVAFFTWKTSSFKTPLSN